MSQYSFGFQQEEMRSSQVETERLFLNKCTEMSHVRKEKLHG